MGKTSSDTTLVRQNTIRRGRKVVRLRQKADLCVKPMLPKGRGNRKKRREEASSKGGINWRQKAQKLGQKKPGKRRTSSRVVKEAVFVVDGGKKIPLPMEPLAEDKAKERSRPRKDPRHTRTEKQATAKVSAG